MTTLVSLYQIIMILLQMELVPGVGQAVKWLPSNAVQGSWLKQWYESGKGEVDNLQFISRLASRDVAPVNEFLLKYGTGMVLDKANENDFVAAAYLDISPEWNTPGKITQIKGSDGNDYPAVEHAEVKFFSCACHDQPIAQIDMTDGSYAYLTMANKPPMDQWDLIATVNQLSGTITPLTQFSKVVFPMVSYEQVATADWLSGLYGTGADNRPACLAKAVQINHLHLSEKGKPKEINPAEIAPTPQIGSSATLFIYRPFYFWITRHDLNHVVFAAYVNYPQWQNPNKNE